MRKAETKRQRKDWGSSEGKRFLDERFKPREVFERGPLARRSCGWWPQRLRHRRGSDPPDSKQSVEALSHFIVEELRPDLSGGALNREPDLWDDAAASKYEKDFKDKEHLAENG